MYFFILKTAEKEKSHEFYSSLIANLDERRRQCRIDQSCSNERREKRTYYNYTLKAKYVLLICSQNILLQTYKKYFPLTMTTTQTQQKADIILDNKNGERTNDDNDEFSNFFIANKTHQMNSISSIVTIAVQISFAVWMCYTYKNQIPFTDIAFGFGYPIYLLLANKYRFNENTSASSNSNGKDDQKTDMKLMGGEEKEAWFATYMLTFAFVGIVLPLCTLIILPLLVLNDDDDNRALNIVLRMSAPHTLLLWLQIVMEGCAMMNPNFHHLIRILVPIGFSAYREKCLWVWFREASLLLVQMQSGGMNTTNNVPNYYSAVCWLNAIVAFCNLIMWSYNLFVTLLLRMVPYHLDQNRSSLSTNMVSWKYCLIPKIHDDSGARIKLSSNKND